MTDEEIVSRATDLLAHLWMVRTFVKHSEEAEEFEDLLELPRVAFDVARALETRLDDVAGLRRMLAKKVPKLRRAAGPGEGLRARRIVPPRFLPPSPP